MNVFDLFEYNDENPENEGTEKLRFHLKKNRFKSLDKDKKLHKHSHKLGEQDVEETASMTKGMKSNHNAFKMQEARKPDTNFDIEDIKRLEQIRDLATLKTQAMALISKPSAKPMRPEKVEWFRSSLEQINSPVKVIKLMYDLMLSGEGHQVIGSRRSMNPNSYRSRFGEQGVAEGSLNEFAPVGGDDREPDEEEILRQLAAQWWNGTEQQMAKAQKTLAAMGWEIGQDESGDDDAGVFVIRAGDINGDSYIAFNHSELNLNEGGAEGSPNFLDDDFYAYDPETKVIQSTWSHKSVGRRHHEYEAQQKGWKVVSGMRAKSLGLLTKDMAEGDLDKFKKYIRPVIKTIPKIERTTNPSGRTTDHVEWIVTSDTGEKRRFTSKKSAQEYYNMCTKRGVAEGSLEEIDRRGFLKGLGAAALAGAAGMSAAGDLEDKIGPLPIMATIKIRLSDGTVKTIKKDLGHAYDYRLDDAKKDLEDLLNRKGIKNYSIHLDRYKDNSAYLDRETKPAATADYIDRTPLKGGASNRASDYMDNRPYNSSKGDKTYMDPAESVANNMNEELEEYLLELELAGYELINEAHQMCPECEGVAYDNPVLAEKQDACYSKVKSRYKVWPSAYASGALVRCRKVGAKNWGNKSKK